jgi:hypothetical protein
MRHEELTVSSLIMDGVKAVATSAAITVNANAGIITTVPLTTAANANYDITISNVYIRAQDLVLANVFKGTDTVGPLTISKVIPANGSVLIGVKNNDGASPLNGTVNVCFAVIKLQ